MRIDEEVYEEVEETLDVVKIVQNADFWCNLANFINFFNAKKGPCKFKVI